MGVEDMKGFSVLLERIMARYPLSFPLGGKQLSAYFATPLFNPMRLRLLDTTLNEVVLHEVERYYEIVR